MRFDLHIHTCHSYDCLLSLESLSAAVQRRGLEGIAVLDHDEIEGALCLSERAPFKVIVGEEIGTLALILNEMRDNRAIRFNGSQWQTDIEKFIEYIPSAELQNTAREQISHLNRDDLDNIGTTEG